MLITAVFIILTAWASFVHAAASHHGRQLGRIHRAATAISMLGASLAFPVVLIGSFGLWEHRPHSWLGWSATLGYTGLALIVCGVLVWLLLDTAFVWRARRRVFPFAYGRRGNDH